jgi:hypothetical protein
MARPLIDATSQHDGSWSNRHSHRISVERTHVAAPRMLTPTYRGKLLHNFMGEYSMAPVDEEWEQETLAWLHSCCQGLWRMDLMCNTVTKIPGFYREQAWNVRFERHSDAVLYKLARM